MLEADDIVAIDLEYLGWLRWRQPYARYKEMKVLWWLRPYRAEPNLQAVRVTLIGWNFVCLAAHGLADRLYPIIWHDSRLQIRRMQEEMQRLREALNRAQGFNDLYDRRIQELTQALNGYGLTQDHVVMIVPAPDANLGPERQREMILEAQAAISRVYGVEYDLVRLLPRGMTVPDYLDGGRRQSYETWYPAKQQPAPDSQHPLDRAARFFPNALLSRPSDPEQVGEELSRHVGDLPQSAFPARDGGPGDTEDGRQSGLREA